MKKIFLLLFILPLGFISKAQYCASASSSAADEEIINFTFANGGINNSTSCANPFGGTQGTGNGQINRYSDFTSIPPASVLGGSTYTFSLSVGACGTFNFTSGAKIYIDYNQDLDFVDPGEEVYFSGVGNAISSIPVGIVTGSITIPLSATPGITRLRVIDWENGQGSATTIVPCNPTTGFYGYGETEDYLINIIPPIPCNGVPSAGIINQPDTVIACPSVATQLCVTGYTNASGLIHQWLKSLNGGASWVGIPGATNLCYLVPAGTASALYRFSTICTTTFDLDSSDNDVYVSLYNPTYTTIPYTQDFENWINYCNTKDVPDDGHWNNTPVSGDASWRREDQGNFGGWAFPTASNYLPSSSSLAHSARFHGDFASTPGTLDLYLDLSTQNGPKDLFFDHKYTQPSTPLNVLFSTNAGATFLPLATFNTTSYWGTKMVTLNSNANQCILRFEGSAFGNGDQGIDNIRAVGPCSGQPTVGLLTDTTACANDSIILQLTGSTQAAGLSFVWESAPSASGPWTNFATTNVNNVKAYITAPTFYRCTVTCIASGLSSTSNVQTTTLNSFYYCYCKSYTTSAFDNFDIGCVQLLKNNSGGTFTSLIYNLPLNPTDTINNSNASNTYTNYQFGLPIQKIYKDSTYTAKITSITAGTSIFGATAVWIDYNRNGLFDPTEQVGGNSIGSSFNVSFSFVVPASAQQGITGMRVISANASAPSSINPCGPYLSGETEDYLVDISLPPCLAPTNPGIAYCSETIICPGYNVLNYDTSHTKLSLYNGLSIQWQISINNGPWSDIAGANTDSLVYNVQQVSKFRMRVICSGQDTVYSNSNTVNLYPSFQCYPASGSLGGNTDTADNGYFTIGTYSYSSGGASGPHVGNPAAIYPRTDFANLGTSSLYVDSTYNISFYNILRPTNHADAKITMFIDYNNNGLYDIPAERVFTGVSTSTSFYLPGSFRTAANAVKDVPTGMRVVLNNNVFANNQSDLGVGLYTSGETEDFIVKFKTKPVVPTSVNEALLFQQVDIYPNPSDGLVNVTFEAYALKNVNIIVSNVIGAEVFRENHASINGKFSSQLDLSAIPVGTYTIKIQTERGSVVHKIVLQ